MRREEHYPDKGAHIMTENTEKTFVTPETLKGCLDYLPEDVFARRTVLSTIESVYQRHGFLPVETPAMEYLNVLLGAGGEETNKELFRLESPEGDAIALRFDHTVPFARLLSQYPDRMKLPFRRYAMGPVWRADKPGPGRYRQFTQIDIDAAGSESVALDAEVIATLCEAMTELGLKSFVILVNNRKIIDALLQGVGVMEIARQKHVLRVMDKLQKVGMENVRRELGDGRIDDSGDPIPGVKLPSDTIDRIVAFLQVKADTRRGLIEALESAIEDSDTKTAALDEMRDLADCLDALGVPESNAVFDPSLARGLDYYTGPVYEITLPDAPQFGSVGGGGRYNRLVERFMDRAIPCTGASIGVDRLVPALRAMNLIPAPKTMTQVLVVSVGKVPPAEALRAAAELRAGGLCAEAYFGQKMSMKVQLSHADAYEIPVAVILGEDELAQGVVSIKDLYAGKVIRENIQSNDAYRQAGKSGQTTVSRGEMIATVKDILEAQA